MPLKWSILFLVLVVFPFMVALSIWVTIRVYRSFRDHRQRIREAAKPYCPSVWHQWTYVIPRLVGTGLLWLKALVDPWVLLIIWKKHPNASLLEVFFKLTLLELASLLVLVWIASVLMELEWAVDQRQYRGWLRLPLHVETLFCDRRRLLAMLGQGWLWHLVIVSYEMIEPAGVVQILGFSEGADLLVVSRVRLIVAIAVAVGISLVFMAGFVKAFEQSLARLKFGQVFALTLGYQVVLAGLIVWVKDPELSGTGMVVLAFVNRFVNLAFLALLPFYYMAWLFPYWIKWKKLIPEG